MRFRSFPAIFLAVLGLALLLWLLAGALEKPLTSPASRDVPSDASRAFPLDLLPVRSVDGVIHGPDEEPIAGAIVDAWIPGLELAGPWSAVSDADGRYTLGSLPDHPAMRLRVLPPPSVASSATAYLPAVVLLTAEAHLAISLERAEAILGVVVTEDNRPVAGLAVYAWGPLGTSRPRRAACRTDMDGEFRLAPVAGGRYMVWTGVPGNTLSHADFIRVDAPARHVLLRCPPGRVIEGQLVGPDAEGFTVSWRRRMPDGSTVGATTRSDEEGRFVLTGWAHGTAEIEAHRAGEDRYGLARLSPWSAPSVTMDLLRARTIEGRIESSDADGIPPVSLWASRVDGAIWARGHVEPGGRFVVRGLPPGPYRLSGGGRDWRLAEREAEAGADDVVLRLVAR